MLTIVFKSWIKIILICLLLLNTSDRLFADGVSILNPAKPALNTTFYYNFDSLNPSAQTHPTNSSTPGFRGVNQMVIYTPAYGNTTRTNPHGEEAVVLNGIVIQQGGYNNPIPPDGFVVSGHGQAAEWIRRFLKPGAETNFEPDSHRLKVRFTPAVYLYQVEKALETAKQREPENPQQYQEYLAQTHQCQQTLVKMAGSVLTPKLVETAEICEKAAHLAYYQTIRANPDEFRGVWLRPALEDPETINQTVTHLKAIGIRDIFLETYYQGKTIYPSPVMETYGLTLQHPRYRNRDPLKDWIQAAHQHGLKVHAWVQVFFAGNQDENIETYGPILKHYPQWRNVQRRHIGTDHPMPSDVEPGHYFLDPANPEVQDFLDKLISEMLTLYPLDGLNLDYIRYPASAKPSTGNYMASTWGYTDSARKQFQEALKTEAQAPETKAALPAKTDPMDLTPANPLWNRWITWKNNQISSFVRRLSEKAHAINPKLLVSAVIFPEPADNFAIKHQDWPTWTQKGYVQALTPIGFSPNPQEMYRQSWVIRQLTADQVPIYAGIFGMYNRVSPIAFINQIHTAQQAGLPGIILFEGSRFTPEYEEALMEGPFRQ